jgi:hypothetical protein
MEWSDTAEAYDKSISLLIEYNYVILINGN